MDDTEARQGAYWRSILRVTSVLLCVWAAASFLPGWFAEDLNRFVFFGWPFGFYMAGQKTLIIFLMIVLIYDRWMIRLEQRYDLDDEA